MSLRTLAMACCCVVALLAVEQASAQNWVSKMFAEKDHDFGTVARGADTVYKFPVKNIYKQDIELVSVRSSCGCTSPTLEHKTAQDRRNRLRRRQVQHAHLHGVQARR